MNKGRFVFYAVAACAGLSAGAYGTRLAITYISPKPQPPAPAAAAVSDDAAEPLHPTPQEWDALTRKIGGMALSYHGRVGIYLKDLRGGRVWTYHPDDLFPSASLIKFPVMACVFRRMQEGGLTLDSELTLTRRDRAGGSGRLKWAPDGSHYTVREVLERMITESDNTALHMLLDTIGMDYFQKGFADLGLVYTQIHPEGLSLVSHRVSNENYTTAREMAMLLDKEYHGELVDHFSSEMMMEYMEGLKTRRRLAKYLPPGWQLAHKTGLLRGACHDVGILMTPQGDYILAVLTSQSRSYRDAKAFIERVARTSYRYLRPDNTELARAEGASYNAATR